MHFDVLIEPTEGFYKSAKTRFQVVVPTDYPHTPPKVTCRTKVYHPNIDLQGAVCLNILRDEWKPVLNLNRYGDVTREIARAHSPLVRAASSGGGCWRCSLHGRSRPQRRLHCAAHVARCAI